MFREPASHCPSQYPLKSCHQQGPVYHFSTLDPERNFIFPITISPVLQALTRFFSDEVQVADVCQEHTQCTPAAVVYVSAEWP